MQLFTKQVYYQSEKIRFPQFIRNKSNKTKETAKKQLKMETIKPKMQLTGFNKRLCKSSANK